MAKQKKAGTSNVQIYCAYFAVFIFFLFMMYCFPLASDDYLFLHYDINRFGDALSKALYYGNGRLLGNLLTIIVVRIPWLLYTVKAVFMTALVVAVSKLTAQGKKEKELPFLFTTFVLVLGVSNSVFSECYSWTSGFNNYVPPIVILLVCVILMQKEHKNIFIEIIDDVIIVVLGICGQLFVEHNTVVNVVIAFAVVIYAFIREKSKIIKSILWFTSTVIGALMMYLIPKIFFQQDNIVDGYRGIHLGGIGETISFAISTLYSICVLINDFAPFFVFLSLLLLVILRKSKNSWNNEKLKKAVEAFIFMFAVFWTGCYFVEKNGSLAKVYPIYSLVRIALAAVFVFCAICVILHIPQKKSKTLSLLSFALAAFSVAPLLVVSPVGGRCLMFCCVFLILGAMSVFNYVLDLINENSLSKIKIATSAVAVITAFAMSFAFANICWMKNVQTRYIESKVNEGAETIETFFYPGEIVHNTFTSFYAFVYNHGTEGDIKFVQVDFDEWYANRQAEGWF